MAVFSLPPPPPYAKQLMDLRTYCDILFPLFVVIREATKNDGHQLS